VGSARPTSLPWTFATKTPTTHSTRACKRLTRLFQCRPGVHTMLLPSSHAPPPNIHRPRLPRCIYLWHRCIQPCIHLAPQACHSALEPQQYHPPVRFFRTWIQFMQPQLQPPGTQMVLRGVWGRSDRLAKHRGAQRYHLLSLRASFIESRVSDCALSTAHLLAIGLATNHRW